jgi:hypothetical protein
VFTAVKDAVVVFFNAFTGRSELGEFDGVLNRINDAAIIFRDALGFVVDAVTVFFNAFTGKSEVNEFDGALRAVNNAGIALAAFVTGTLVPAFVSIVEHLRGPLTGAFNGAMDLLGSLFTSVKNVAEFLSPILLAALRLVATAVGVTFVAALTLLGPVLTAVGATIQGITGFLAAHKTAVAAVAGVVTALFLPAILTTTAAFVANTVAVGAWMVAQMAARVATTVMTAAQWLLNAALTANPIGLVVAAIALLAAGVVLAYRHSETFRGIVQTLWEWLKKFVGFTPLGALIENFDKVRAAVSWVVDKVQELIGALKKIKMPKLDIPGGGLLGKIPGFASGVSNFGGGLALVGEQGPEVVSLRRGSSVLPAPQTADLLAGSGGVHIGTLVVPPAQDASGAGRAVALALRMAL